MPLDVPDLNRTARLRVLTMPPDEPPLGPPPCEDEFICTCPVHTADRVIAIRRGPIGEGPAAFTIRPARQAA